jgi:hypothetical protein
MMSMSDSRIASRSAFSPENDFTGDSGIFRDGGGVKENREGKVCVENVELEVGMGAVGEGRFNGSSGMLLISSPLSSFSEEGDKLLQSFVKSILLGVVRLVCVSIVESDSVFNLFMEEVSSSFLRTVTST